MIFHIFERSEVQFHISVCVGFGKRMSESLNDEFDCLPHQQSSPCGVGLMQRNVKCHRLLT